MVGGPQAVNARMDALGFHNTRARNVPSRWFPALTEAPSRDAFAREGKHPFGLSTPREMGRLLELMARHARGQAVVRSDAADHARPAVSYAHSAIRDRLHHSSQDG